MTDTVEITLGGKAETLRPSLEAAMRINAIEGGLNNVAHRLAALDMVTYIEIVAAGMGKKAEDVRQHVYEAGVANLAGPVSQFVSLVAYGGNPPKSQEGGGSGE